VSVSFVRVPATRDTRVIPAIYPWEQVEKHQRGAEKLRMLPCWAVADSVKMRVIKAPILPRGKDSVIEQRGRQTFR